MSAPRRIPFSVLDLAWIAEGSTPAQALQNTRDLAQHAERWGYHRYWLAEHHNMPGVACCATSIVLGYVAAATSRMRVGSGGIMLPNHAPLVVAEQFGTLDALYPGRIDLGLGRAPGTDDLTVHALRRDPYTAADSFPQDVLELQTYFQATQPGQKVSAIPAAGRNVPLWILGSSTYGAQVAAALGLPYAFASHFAPQELHAALEVYRDQFQPSEYLQAPYVMLSVHVYAADTADEAQYLSTTLLQLFYNLRRGTPRRLQAPSRDFEQSVSAAELVSAKQAMRYSCSGTKEMIAAKLREFVEQTQADEIMIASPMFDHDARLRSYEIVAEIEEMVKH